MLSIDRRWLYLILGLAVIVTLVLPVRIPVTVSSEVTAVHDFVGQVRDGEVMHLALEYDPSTMAELHPMAEAILRQVFEQNGRLIMSSLSQFGPAMADELIQRVAREYNKRSGSTTSSWATSLIRPSRFWPWDDCAPFPNDYYGADVTRCC
jgi:hypothetical protein